MNHYDGPAVKRDDKGKLPNKRDQKYEVCGKAYAVTGAELKMGANVNARAVFTININSVAKSAPVWNRASGGNLKNTKYLFVTMIIKKEANRHMKKIMGSFSPPKE
ncbi:hypothetical protein K458DRAFT_394603 [Lentithecium fluviatile CBS 122367]|uniref:Uncharacterized protein n=1 Tax=Lentithecium fluviatile CBS 122367 TaxID=1168545 RepID=A0A6G1IL74_9PLEO|nr:hypothetical protein K458DRAFT_394603 [Lentithecium fluviatile CBS 122367]